MSITLRRLGNVALVRKGNVYAVTDNNVPVVAAPINSYADALAWFNFALKV